MLPGSIRQRLTRNDAELALQLLVRLDPGGEPQLRAAVREQGIDILLDDPRLPDALRTQETGVFASLPLLVYVLVRRAMREVREDDRTSTDFVSSIVLHFGLGDRARRIREHDDVTYDTLGDLAVDAEAARPFDAVAGGCGIDVGARGGAVVVAVAGVRHGIYLRSHCIGPSVACLLAILSPLP